MRVGALVLLLTACAWAHVGAPYVVLLDRPVGPYRLTVWSDPDVGEGSFYLLASEGGQPVPVKSASITVRPADGHLPESSPVATRPVTWKSKPGREARVPFDRVGRWEVRVRVEEQAPVTFPVEVTPAGPGWLGWALGLIPCLVSGLVWWLGFRRMRERATP